MKSAEQLLRVLEREEVLEVVLASDRRPSARVGSSFDPVDDDPLSSPAIFAILVAAGGSRYVDALGPSPKQWALRVPGLGEVRVSAALRGEQVLARFSLAAVRSAPGGSARRPSQSPRSTGRARPTVRVRAAAAAPEGPLSVPAPAARASRAQRAEGEEFRLRATSPAVPRAREDGVDAPGRAVITQPARPVVRTRADLGALLEQARTSRATDLHVVAGRPPLFRIGGDLVAKGDAIPEDAVEEMTRPLLRERVSAALEAQGSCDFALEHPLHGRFRVNVARQLTGLKICLRLIPMDLPTVSGLRLPPELARAAGYPHGLVLFTGPSGHGKTTTLTAVVDRINETLPHHVLTVEDPVEHVHAKKKALISQREVGTHTATFASALAASLREDPDVLVVGEIVDVEAVRMAVAASETGHLVLATLNAPSAVRAIDRILDLLPPEDQPQVRLALSSTLRLVVGQRLVPSPDRSRVHAAFELLPGSPPVLAAIRDNKTSQIPGLQQRGKGLGIVRLDHSLLDLVKTGRATAADVVPFAENPPELEAALQRKPSSLSLGAAPRSA
jgi:twitching motility protein PilT